MYFTVDADGIVRSVNLFGAHQLGYLPEELVGQPVTDIFIQEDQRSAARQLKAALRKPGAVVGWELRKQKKTGEVIWVKETARATLDSSGNPIVLIVCEDITERRRMEEELQKAREELEHKVEKQLEFGNPYGLTFRQLTILHLIADGQSDKEIGTVLGISPLTVAKHVSRVLRRMNASSRTEAGVRAFRERLIT
jgi:PAS domain S-box-containing protein